MWRQKLTFVRSFVRWSIRFTAVHRERWKDGKCSIVCASRNNHGLTHLIFSSFFLFSLFIFSFTIVVAEAPNGNLMGYVLGKAEGDDKLWHGHVSAVTVAPSYRRLGLAKTLMDEFETVCVHTYNAYFVDLFVRASNHLAQRMYEKFGYSTYRRVLGYYAGEAPEDALDMRKALPRDVTKESVIPLDHPVLPEQLEW